VGHRAARPWRPAEEAEGYNKRLYASQGYLTHTLKAYAANPVWTEDPKRAAFRDATERSLTIGGFAGQVAYRGRRDALV